MGKRLGILLNVVGIGLVMMIMALYGCGNNSVSTVGPAEPFYISGTPNTTAIVGQLYTFTPSISGVDTSNLTFSITTVSPSTLPAWLNFNPQNGTLSGTPASSDVGLISGIVISVSNGTVNESLPAFNLTVTVTGSTGSSGGTGL